MQHDKCYDNAVNSKICFDVPWEYIDDYNWKCINSTAICDGKYENLLVLLPKVSVEYFEKSPICPTRKKIGKELSFSLLLAIYDFIKFQRVSVEWHFFVNYKIWFASCST
ncbi:unnamed protein product [Angiostrongylus costaricensis]|uniref:Uncharacterized protein n=1 Tax=Angiostrongylus costaricensis TaxID=334426 RepID=A0A0R3PSW9_ANGCS|nr:unnamed protein product [Angiostrongylus costaricensis]